MGDSSFLRILRELASAPRPLVRLEPGPNASPLPQRIAITTSGREVLDGRDDWVRMPRHRPLARRRPPPGARGGLALGRGGAGGWCRAVVVLGIALGRRLE